MIVSTCITNSRALWMILLLSSPEACGQEATATVFGKSSGEFPIQF